MATIWEVTSSALVGLSVPVLSGAYVPDTPGGALPDTYMVFLAVDISPIEHADDEEVSRDYLMQVNVYARGGLVGLPDVIGAMVAAGFMFSGGRQLDYDIETRHYGIAFDFEYLESLA